MHLRDLQSKQRWSESAFSIIYVEISGHGSLQNFSNNQIGEIHDKFNK